MASARDAFGGDEFRPGLLEEYPSIPAVAKELPLIHEVQSDEWWADVALPMLEHVRRQTDIDVEQDLLPPQQHPGDHRIAPRARIAARLGRELAVGNEAMMADRSIDVSPLPKDWGNSV